MASRWDGKIGKIKPWTSKGQSKRTSFIPPKSTEPHPDTCEFEEGRESIPSLDDIITGQTREFNPQEEYNFKSAYKRYLKALDIRPSKIETQDKKTIYYYYSCNSNSGFWEVTVDTGDEGTFINPIPSLIIVCPPASGYKITGIESDGVEFIWEQKAGNRTVLFDDNTIKEPTIFIQSTCYTGNCTDGSPLPIILRVSLANNPAIFQDLVIYNTLTSTHFGNSASSGITSDRACQKVTFIPAPRFLQKAYCGDETTPILVTWNPPSCDSEFVTGYSLVVNTTGSYIEIDSVSLNDEPLFELEFGKHYKIVTHFNIYGNVFSTPSDIIYLSTGGIQHFLFGDDTYNGLSCSKQSQSITTLNLKATQYIYEDIYPLLSSSKQSQNIVTLNLKATTYEYSEPYNGIAASKQSNSYTKVNLGGVIIG